MPQKVPESSSESAVAAQPAKPFLSLDVWAVLLSFLLALLVKLGVLQHVSW
jgi:hypothetical protein